MTEPVSLSPNDASRWVRHATVCLGSPQAVSAAESWFGLLLPVRELSRLAGRAALSPDGWCMVVEFIVPNGRDLVFLYWESLEHAAANIKAYTKDHAPGAVLRMFCRYAVFEERDDGPPSEWGYADDGSKRVH